jgi:cysteine desulfurase
MRIYLDNNATTPLDPAVLDALQRALRDSYGNPSSIHREGQAARRTLEQAREEVAALLGAAAREIVFTSGGTEANNAALFGVIGSAKGSHVVTTAIEHPSILEAVNVLKQRGAEVTTVGCDGSGRVRAEVMIAAIRRETSLVTMMLANNETGVIQPVAEVAQHCRARGVPFHCDAVQAAGRIPVDVKALDVDTISVSAHKFHGPKGIGALYVRSGTILEPFVVGGAQERRRRAGTENAPLAAGFGVAATLARNAADGARMLSLRDSLEEGLRAAGLPVVFNGGAEERLPNTSSATFRGADGEALVIGLDLNDVAVSTGSACSSGRVEASDVLLAMGLPEPVARGTIRISLSRFTTAQQIERVIELITILLPKTIAAAAMGP